MALQIAILLFVLIALAIFAFGAAIIAPSSVLGARLRSLATQRSQAQREKPAIKERFEQALDPDYPASIEANKQTVRDGIEVSAADFPCLLPVVFAAR